MAEMKASFEKGKTREYNKDYLKLSWRRNTLVKKLNREQAEEIKKSIWEEIKTIDKVHKSIPCKNPMDENFRRLQYVRYADDFIIGIIGSKEDAKVVKETITAFISAQLHLELSDEKRYGNQFIAARSQEERI